MSTLNKSTCVQHLFNSSSTLVQHAISICYVCVFKGFQDPRRPVESPLAIADIGLDLQVGGAYGHG
jgi:Ni,Fe-hydrogenase I small subunit